jgi:CubicO group peptidase (beta-lactamase class C family)
MRALLASLMVAGTTATPAADWPRSTPDAQGMDAAALAALDGAFRRGDHGYVDGMLVIRHGHVVWDAAYRHDYASLFKAEHGPRGIYNYYDPEWHPYHRGSDLHTMQSVSKSVTSALVGLALHRGELRGLDEAVLSFFPGYPAADDPRWRRMTVRHLLTMTTGIRWDESTVAYTDPANSCARMEASQDWLRFVLAQPMAEEPGRTFVYNSGATQLLSQVLKQATGVHADEYAARHLFAPLGIGAFQWKKTPTGHPDTEGGLYLRPHDLARLGMLYLKGGTWSGTRLLPERWVAESTAPAVDVVRAGGPPWKYGYQWWLVPAAGAPGGYVPMALGYGGQRLMVVPQHDLVAVFTGWNIYDKPALDSSLALEKLTAAVRR